MQLKFETSKKNYHNIYNYHNLQGYDGHTIFKELNNFNVDIDVIPKGIDKYMSIIGNRYII